MGVQRFRSIKEMNAAPVRRSETAGFERFIRHNARIRLLSSRSHPQGVFRFRNLEDAQRSRFVREASPDHSQAELHPKTADTVRS